VSVLDGSGVGAIEDAVHILELQTKYEESMRIINQLRMRLVKRTEMISEIRTFYLRDIVTMKFILSDLLTGTERQEVMDHYMERLPSLDLKSALALHAPQNSEMQIVPCEQCGGKVEVVLIDSPEVERLNQLLAGSKEREQRFRGTLAELDAKTESLMREKQEESKSHNEEVCNT